MVSINPQKKRSVSKKYYRAQQNDSIYNILLCLFLNITRMPTNESFVQAHEEKMKASFIQ